MTVFLHLYFQNLMQDIHTIKVLKCKVTVVLFSLILLRLITCCFYITGATHSTMAIRTCYIPVHANNVHVTALTGCAKVTPASALDVLTAQPVLRAIDVPMGGMAMPRWTAVHVGRLHFA